MLVKKTKAKSVVSSVLEEAHVGAGAEGKFKAYERQQGLIKLLRYQLRRQEAAIQAALNEGAFINARTQDAPLQRYADRQVPSTEELPVDLRELLGGGESVSGAVHQPSSSPSKGKEPIGAGSHEEIAALRERIQSLAAQVAKLKQVGKVLTEKKTTHEAEIERLEKENVRLRSKIEPVGTTLREAILTGTQDLSSIVSNRELLMQARIDSLTEELQEARDEIKQSHKEAAEMQQRATETLLKPPAPNELMARDLARLREQVDKLRAIKEQVVREMRAMARGGGREEDDQLRDMELEHSKEELEQERLAKETLQKRVDELCARIGDAPLVKELQAQLAHAVEEANKVKKENTALRVQVLEAKMRTSAASRVPESLPVTTSDAPSVLSPSSGDKGGSEGSSPELHAAQERAEELEGRVEQLEVEVGRTQKMLEEERLSKDKAVVQLKNMMKVMKILKEKYDTDVSGVGKGDKEAEEELRALKEENTDLLAEIEDLRELSQLQQEEKEALLKETEYANQAKADTLVRLRQMEKRHAEGHALVEEMRLELETLRGGKPAEREESLAEPEEGQTGRLEREKEDAEAALEAARAECAVVREEAARAQQECARDMSNAVEAVQMELLAMRGERDRLQREEKDTLAALAAREEECAALRLSEARATAALMELSSEANSLRQEIAVLQASEVRVEPSDLEARLHALQKENEDMKVKLAEEVQQLKRQSVSVHESEVLRLKQELQRVMLDMAVLEREGREERQRLVEALQDKVRKDGEEGVSVRDNDEVEDSPELGTGEPTAVAQSRGPSRPVVEPRVPMKPLFWRRIVLPPPSSSASPPDTVWEVIRREEHRYSLPLDQFEECFGKLGRREGGERSGFVVKALDTKRYQKVAIMMSGLPSDPVLRDAIYNFDGSKLSRQQVRNLLENLPKPQEVESIIEAREALPEGKLDRPEAFLMSLQEIPNIKRRLKCWLFMRTLPETINNLEPPLLAISDASDELLQSESLRVVLGLILALGNHMNGGGERGQADGFALDVLPTLNSVPGAKDMTLLEYLASLLRERDPDISARLASELSLLDEAADISLEKMEPSLRLLKDKLKKTLRLSHGIDDDAFTRTIVPFLDAARIQIRELEGQYEAAQDKYHSCLAFYVPSEARHKFSTSKSFFRTLAQFVSQLRACIEPKKKPYSKGKIGGGEDPMASIIAAIRAGQTPNL